MFRPTLVALALCTSATIAPAAFPQPAPPPATRPEILPCDSGDFARDPMVQAPRQTPKDQAMVVPPSPEARDQKMRVIPTDPERVSPLPKCTMPPSDRGTTEPLPGAAERKRR